MNNPAHRQAIQPTGRQSSPQAGNPAHRQAIQPTGRQSHNRLAIDKQLTI